MKIYMKIREIILRDDSRRLFQQERHRRCLIEQAKFSVLGFVAAQALQASQALKRHFFKVRSERRAIPLVL